MAAIRGRDTVPEIRVRSLLPGLGYRFRLHRRDLPREIPNLILDGRWFLPHTRALPFLLESIAGLESLTLLHFERLRDLSTLDGCAALRHLGLQAPALESLATMGRPPALAPFSSTTADDWRRSPPWSPWRVSRTCARRDAPA